MNSFFDRTKGLDRHLAAVVRHRARVIKRHNDKYHNGEDLCGDAANMRKLSVMFNQHEDTEKIYDFMYNQDTAFRDEIPRKLWEIVEEWMGPVKEIYD